MHQTNATKIVNDGLTITLQQQKTREFNDDILKSLLDIYNQSNILDIYKVLCYLLYGGECNESTNIIFDGS